jgi:hypothetical protein
VFSSTKLENRRLEQVLLRGGGGLALAGGGWYGERGRRLNTVQIMYTHVCKWKDDNCWNCSRNQGREDEKEQLRGWI